MELIIKNKTEKRTKTSIVINLDKEKRGEIERLAEASGHTINEIVELLIGFALPHCKLADEVKQDGQVEATITDDVKKKTKSTKTKEPKSTETVTKEPKTKEPRTTASRTSAKTKTLPKEEVTKTEAQTEEIKPTRTRSTLPHAGVPTFKLPPIKPKNSKKS